MAEVIGIDRKPIESNLRALKSDEAKVALRALLDLVDSGEIVLTQWFMIFEEQHPGDPGRIRSDYMDSGITVSSAVYMLERAKIHILTQMDK